MKAINPATELVAGDYPEHDPAAVERALATASAAFIPWRGRSVAQRAAMTKSVAAVLRRQINDLARLITTEMGKPITAAAAEIDKCAIACDYYAQQAGRFLSPRTVPSDATISYVRYDPLGCVLAIMPWNFPFWQVFRFAAPALTAGNVAILKHASNVPGCALAIEKVFADAGLPPGVFTSLLVDGARAQALIGHRHIAAVTLTGSESAGMAVAAAAGKALKKSVLELGGSDPFMVLADVDVDAVAKAGAAARCINSGQSCIAAKRFIVDYRIVEHFTQALAEQMQHLKVGDPLDRTTYIGPLARQDLLGDLHQQVQRSCAAGAKLICGGQRLQRPGYYYAPTVLGDVRPGMAAFDEETFGPVAAVISAGDLQEMIALANASGFGLGASIWSRDIDRAQRMAEQLECGCVFINGGVKSDPRLPFGGVKRSGYGRELSDVGMHEFVNIKTVWVKDLQQPPSPNRSE
jgi:succinate-semialdehyde dehydrogenase/glutarate-semialdehyde dehydrogenase